MYLSVFLVHIASVLMLVWQGFGEIALLSDDGIRTASVIARERVSCLTINRNAFLKAARCVQT